MPDEWTDFCPGCGAALIVDAPFDFLERWPEMRDCYGFHTVALSGGWEKAGLVDSVSVDSCEAALCDAVYVGDLITDDIACPRCRTPIATVLRCGK